MKNLKKVLIVSALLMLLNVIAPASQGYINRPTTPSNPGGGFTTCSDMPYAD